MERYQHLLRHLTLKTLDTMQSCFVRELCSGGERLFHDYSRVFLFLFLFFTDIRERISGFFLVVLSWTSIHWQGILVHRALQNWKFPEESPGKLNAS